MATYLWRDEKWVPKEEVMRAERTGRYGFRGHVILDDIEPYRAITGDMEGKMITSRSKHRAFLQRNKLIEVGNEKDYFTKNDGKSPDNPNLMSERQHEEQICQSIVKNLQR